MIELIKKIDMEFHLMTDEIDSFLGINLLRKGDKILVDQSQYCTTIKPIILDSDRKLGIKKGRPQGVAPTTAQPFSRAVVNTYFPSW